MTILQTLFYVSATGLLFSVIIFAIFCIFIDDRSNAKARIMSKYATLFLIITLTSTVVIGLICNIIMPDFMQIIFQKLAENAI